MISVAFILKFIVAAVGAGTPLLFGTVGEIMSEKVGHLNLGVEGMMAIGKIQSAEEIGRYYMHGVSHHLGLDTHDCAVREDLGLRAGMVISDEPGLYIDEEEIGIRIEDDLLITDAGCRVLSEAIPRTTEEIEALMAH